MNAWKESDSERLLAGMDLFADVDARDRDELARKATHRTYKAGELIIHTGGGGHSLFVVISGKVHVTIEGGPKGQQVVSTFGQGEIFGEMALLSHAHRTATVTAVGEVEALEFAADDVRPLLDGFEGFKAKLSHINAEREKEHRAALMGD